MAHKSTRIYPLVKLPDATFRRIMDGLVESAKVWNQCVRIHAQTLQDGSDAPNASDLHVATRGRYALYAQSVQQVFRSFLGCVAATETRKNRAEGNNSVRYPHRKCRTYPLMWPRQAFCVLHGDADSRLVLPMGRGRPSICLTVPRSFPKRDHIQGLKIVWNRGLELHVLVNAPVEPEAKKSGVHACVDPGEIHLACVVTDDGQALLVSGREIRSQKRLIAKVKEDIRRLQRRCTPGSRRWRKLQAAKRTLCRKAENRIRDARHKASRQVISFCRDRGVEDLFIGKGPKTRNSVDIRYIQEKASRSDIRSFTGREDDTSCRCPVCGFRRHPEGRCWSCPECGFSGHRDVVGAVNMHVLTGRNVPVPTRRNTLYLRPVRRTA